MPTLVTSKRRAREWYLEVQDSAGSAWERIAGLNSLTPSGATTMVDVTDFEDEGFLRQYVGQRDGTVTASCHYAEAADGTKGDGIARVETLLGEVGPDSIGKFRIRRPLATSAVAFDASVSGPITLTGSGGGLNDPNAFDIELMISGEPAVATV